MATDTSMQQQNRHSVSMTTPASIPVQTEEPINGDLACVLELSRAQNRHSAGMTPATVPVPTGELMAIWRVNWRGRSRSQLHLKRRT